MTISLAAAHSAGLELSLDDLGRLVIEGPAEEEPLALDLLAQEESVVTAIAVLDLARAHAWEGAVIVGGGRHGSTLILGEVVGGSEGRWRAFVERASMAHLQEALALMLASHSAV
jgi:hypothetical protein